MASSAFGLYVFTLITPQNNFVHQTRAYRLIKLKVQSIEYAQRTDETASSKTNPNAWDMLQIQALTPAQELVMHSDYVL